MNNWKPLTVLALVAVAACSGGGAADNTSNPSSTSALPPSASGTAASGVLTIQPNGSTASTSSTNRRPAYISPSTTYATLFIDYNPLGTRQLCNSAVPCTFQWSSTSGQHTFSVETDNAAGDGGGGGTILSEGATLYTLNAGANNTLGDMTLNSEIGQINLTSENSYAANSAQCLAVSTSQNCFTGTFTVADASGKTITGPGNFVEPLWPDPTDSTIAQAYGYALTTGPDIFGTDYPFAFYCLPNSNGTFGAIAFGSDPSTYINTAEKTAYNLADPTVTTSGFPTYQCVNGVIGSYGASSGTVTVQSTTR